MNDILMRRLIGLLVLLALVFLLTWLLPDNWSESGEKGVPSTTLPLVSGGPYDSPPAAPAGSPPPPPAAPAAPPAAALPEPVDAVDASAPPLPAAAPPAAKTAAAPSVPAPAPVQAPAPVVPPPPKAAASTAPRPPALKLSQSLPVMPKSTAAPPQSSKPMPPPTPIPVPVAPRLATTVQAPPPPAPVTTAAQAKLWYVQIGSFSDQGNAQTTQNLLQNIGYRGESQQTTGAGGNILYRVRLGPFPSEAVAQQALDKVTHQGYPQARVLSEAAAAKH